MSWINSLSRENGSFHFLASGCVSVRYPVSFSFSSSFVFWSWVWGHRVLEVYCFKRVNSFYPVLFLMMGCSSPWTFAVTRQPENFVSLGLLTRISSLSQQVIQLATWNWYLTPVHSSGSIAAISQSFSQPVTWGSRTTPLYTSVWQYCSYVAPTYLSHLRKPFDSLRRILCYDSSATQTIHSSCIESISQKIS